MYPHERSLVARLADKPFALLGVNSDADPVELKKVMEEEKITWRSWFDGSGGPIAGAWAIRGWPSIFVLDPAGVIRYKDVRGEDMDRAVDQLLEELAANSYDSTGTN